ncbi:MAG: nucleotidyltransferase family protein [Clostridia bacterium]|nr:nucleotidyltransferase family protein [Clostridia bacterium]
MGNEELFQVLRKALWNEGTAAGSWDVYRELSAQAVSALPGFILPSLQLPDDLLKHWKCQIYGQIMRHDAYMEAQQSLPVTVPYVILKGSSAAKYYPHPELRAMGDIDVMTRREDYEAACRMLLENGYLETTDECDEHRARHRKFEKNGFTVEIHILFASMNSPETTKRFDDLIISNITPSHVLPDLVNGMVLIEHINQHMEYGLGLRQIIDFMMFAHQCLTEETWPAFEKMLEETGLKTLALAVMRMCEIYLGLSSHPWCVRIDEKLCAHLMDYVLSCGDFGGKRERSASLSTGRAEKLRHPIAALRELQQRGEENWPGAKKPYLKPFAWLWQGCRFFRETEDLAGGYATALQHSRLFDALGVRREAEGLVYYEDGQYIIKNKK